MKSFPIFIVFLFLAISTVASASQAMLHPSQVILNPSQDATIYSGDGDTNYGTDYQLLVGKDYGWLDTLIQFDLSSYSGVVVESAYLRLYVFAQSGTFPPTDIWIGRVAGSWDEMTVTWYNNPGVDAWGYISGPGSVDSWWVIDVASYVNEWVSGSHGNYGFALGTTDDNNDYFNMFSKEYTDPNYHPQLELNYHDVSVQPTSLGIIKAIYK